MGYLLLVFLLIVFFVFMGLRMGKLEPQRPKILVPLVLVSLLIIVGAIMTQTPWYSELLTQLTNWYNTGNTEVFLVWLYGYLQSL